MQRPFPPYCRKSKWLGAATHILHEDRQELLVPRLIPRGAPHGAWQMGGAENLLAEPETFGAVLDPVCVCLLYLILGRQFLEESGDDVLCAPVCQTLTAGASHTSPPCSIPARERQPPVLWRRVLSPRTT